MVGWDGVSPQAPWLADSVAPRWGCLSPLQGQLRLWEAWQAWALAAELGVG